MISAKKENKVFRLQFFVNFEFAGIKNSEQLIEMGKKQNILHENDK